MNILITGASGFIGQNMVRHLAKSTHKISALTSIREYKKKSKFYSNDVVDIPHDLTDFQETLSLFEEEKPDVVFALAANHGGIGHITTEPYNVMKTNLQIDINTIEAAKHTKVKRFIYASSACVYSKAIAETGIPLAEYHVKPYDPDGEYGWGKLTTEKLLAVSNLNYAAVRLHTVYGPGVKLDESREKVPTSLCRKIAKAYSGDSIIIWGDGGQMRTFCHIQDTVEGLEKLMNSKYCGPINIGSEELITVNQLAEYIIKTSGKTVQKKYNLSMPVGVSIRGTDLTLAKRILDWYPKIKIKDGIKELYEWVVLQISKKS